jgi:hypothetical protein
MPGSPQSIPPSWNESESFRETTLIWIADAADREALRRVGRLIHDLALEATREPSDPGEPSQTRAELGAVVAELRHLEGYLAMVGREAEESTLEPDDDALAHFAGKLAGRVGALVEKIERRLS